MQQQGGPRPRIGSIDTCVPYSSSVRAVQIHRLRSVQASPRAIAVHRPFSVQCVHSYSRALLLQVKAAIDTSNTDVPRYGNSLNGPGPSNFLKVIKTSRRLFSKTTSYSYSSCSSKSSRRLFVKTPSASRNGLDPIFPRFLNMKPDSRP